MTCEQQCYYFLNLPDAVSRRLIQTLAYKDIMSEAVDLFVQFLHFGEQFADSPYEASVNIELRGPVAVFAKNGSPSGPPIGRLGETRLSGRMLRCHTRADKDASRYILITSLTGSRGRL